MDYNELSPELRAKVSACKSSEEVIELAKSVGVSLTDEQLDSISGGGAWSSSSSDSPIMTVVCSVCKKGKISYDRNIPGIYICPDCGKGLVEVFEDGTSTPGWFR